MHALRVFRHVHDTAYTRGSQKTTFRSQFSPSIMGSKHWESHQRLEVDASYNWMWWVALLLLLSNFFVLLLWIWLQSAYKCYTPEALGQLQVRENKDYKPVPFEHDWTTVHEHTAACIYPRSAGSSQLKFQHFVREVSWAPNLADNLFAIKSLSKRRVSFLEGCVI